MTAPNRWDWLIAAEAIARVAHYGAESRYDSRPYIDHVSRVAARCNTDEAKAVAWLHDVVEDTDVTLDALRSAGLPDTVLVAVDLLTCHTPHEYEAYIQRIAQSGNALAVAVKLADINDNLRDSCPDHLMARYKKARGTLLDAVWHGVSQR
jgi:(p)ppGpp synthase/HD superfamily hydrolase